MNQHDANYIEKFQEQEHKLKQVRLSDLGKGIYMSREVYLEFGGTPEGWESLHNKETD